MNLTVEELADSAYSAYCHAVGGVAFNGDPLPKWEEFSKDPAKEKQANGWRKAAEAVYAALSHGGGL